MYFRLEMSITSFVMFTYCEENIAYYIGFVTNKIFKFQSFMVNHKLTVRTDGNIGGLYKRLYYRSKMREDT